MDLEEVRLELIEAGAPEVVLLAADQSDRQATSELAQSHHAAFGSMNALILNAGVGTGGPIHSCELGRVDKTFEVNFVAALMLIRACLPLLRRGAASSPDEGSKIVGVSSITGVYSEAGLAIYGASKAALIALLEGVNREEATHGITATAIAPGYVVTDMSAWVSDTIPIETMIPIEDVVRVVNTVLELSSLTTIDRVVMSRSHGNGYSA